MDIFTKITAFFVSIAIAIGGWFQYLKPAIPEAKTAEELAEINYGFKTPPIADELYVISGSQIKGDEYHTLVCLQGLANREKVQLVIANGWMVNTALGYMEQSGIKLVKNDENGNLWTLRTLIEKFKNYIADSGYVLYRYSEFAEGLNTANNYATLKGWLAVPTELKDFAESCGLTLKKDISEEKYDYRFLRKFFNEYKKEFSESGIVHVKSVAVGLRDFAIQQGMYICYTDSTSKGDRFLKKVLNSIGESGLIMGWCELEKNFVKLASKQGYAVSPADYSYNLSVLNSFECDFTAPAKHEKITPSPDKHYVSFVFSDGDNVQWVTNGCSEYYRHLALERDYPLTWGLPCICQEICPNVTKTMYAAVDDKTDFIAGPSGIGYALPSVFEEKSMDRYTTQTAAAMLRSGIRIVNILDDKPSAIKTASFIRKFDYYSRFDNIDGGIVFLDPNKYESGAGEIWFSNGKPFVSVRKSLWADEGYDGVTDEWMAQQAEEINSYEANNNSVDGYSAICIHAWSMTPEKLNEFVKLLDDHIEIVSTTQLIDMIAENVNP